MERLMAKVKNPFVEALQNIAERQDVGSFKKIFDYFGPRLKSFLMKSGADDAVAEEIIQETMTIIWTKADYYDPSVASPSTWIYTAILPPVESKADENIEHDQKFEMVAQYLDDLPKDQLDLLKMNFFEEKSHGEIAEITKIPLGTVKSRIRLALEKIRGKLEQDGSMVNLNNNSGSMVN